jgi:hypothetical protein
MLAMPMLVPYMYCFVEWAASGRVCTQLKMESNFDMSGSTSFEVRRAKSCLDFFSSPTPLNSITNALLNSVRTSPTKSFGAVVILGTSNQYPRPAIHYAVSSGR